MSDQPSLGITGVSETMNPSLVAMIALVQQTCQVKQTAVTKIAKQRGTRLTAAIIRAATVSITHGLGCTAVRTAVF
jgi:hypothetical protein